MQMLFCNSEISGPSLKCSKNKEVLPNESLLVMRSMIEISYEISLLTTKFHHFYNSNLTFMV